MPPVHPNLELCVHTDLILDSYRRLTGRALLDPDPPPAERVEALFTAPLVVVSHGTEADPLLNYGNRLALELWDMTWLELIGTPSRLTAEPARREERERLLERVALFGFIDDYSGVRVSKTGRRFRIDRATVWNLSDRAGDYLGQAAAFSQWVFLP